MNVLFVDRDGTLIKEPDDFQVDRLDKIRLVENVIPALQEFVKAGYRIVMVSNQDGLGTDAFPTEDFEAPQQFVIDLFASQGIPFDEVFICPHLPEDRCECRKPRAGLLTRYLAANAINLQRSAVVGDRETDVQLADAIGVPGFLLDEATTWDDVVERVLRADRTASVRRNTNETTIDLEVNLDSTRSGTISSGIGFFDHMLEQISKHGGFRLDLKCTGDLHIDEHHTVEDVAIALGTALRNALGNKHGIGRYGFVLPMDESRAEVAIDLSGRGSFRFEGNWPRDTVGELSTEMVEHFFRSLAEQIGAALHIKIQGENAHHMVEACFKAVGRGLRQAFAVSGTELPSTKGLL